MTKYIVYAELQEKPIRKFKREYDAVDFVTDFRNLADYGCMTLIMESDSGKYIWDRDLGDWRSEPGETV